MAKEPVNTTTDSDDWEEQQIGFGEEWDFEKNGDLIGTFIGNKEIDLPERSQRDGRTTAKIWEYMLDDTGEIVFLWDSHQLAEAMTKPGTGDKVKIKFEGYRKFDGSDGPRQVKQYRLWTKKS